MANPIIQSQVNAGELSPSVYGRVDLAKYRQGCSTLRNMFCSYKGGAVSRAGTMFVGYARQDVNDPPPALIPFQFSVDQGYLLVFSEEEMSVVANGSYVLNDPITLSSVTNANPGVFTTAAPHGFTTTDWVYFADMEGMTEFNNSMWAVDTLPTSTSLTIKNILSGVTVSTTQSGTYTASSGTVASLFVLATPYQSEDLQALKWAQSADVMTITHPNYAPYDLARIDLNTWTLTKTTFSASISPPSTLSATATTITTQLITNYNYVVTSIDDDTDEESIGSSVAVSRNSVNMANLPGAVKLSWPSVTGADRYNVYKALTSFGQPSPIGSLYGYAGTSFGLTFVDTNIVQDMTITPPLHQNPFATSAITSFSVSATGSGWSEIIPPIVTITDSSGSGAVGTAVVVNGGVQSIIVNNGGEGYTAPTISIAYDTGSGAVFAPVANGAGRWDGGSSPTNVTITNGGSGYTQGKVTVIATYPSTLATGGITTTLFATSVTVTAGAVTAVTFPIFVADEDKPAAVDVTIVAIGASTTTASATATIGPSTGTWPSCVAYFQQRRVYANTDNNPDTYFASQPGAFTNMDSSVPTNAADAIVGTPWGQQVNGIEWMVPMPGGLVVLTGLGAWQLSGGSATAPLAPDNQVATAQAYNGCNPLVKPITINYDILYVQAKGSIVRDLSYDFFTNIYTGVDLTVLSNHLFTGFNIERWDWAEEPNKLIWAVRDDGKLLSMTYMRGPYAFQATEGDVFSWARHDTQGLFKSVACVTEPPVDAPYFAVQRFAG